MCGAKRRLIGECLAACHFGRISHGVALLIVFAIFAAQLVISPIWLRHFRFGPAEWAWRSLTYWRMQPMRRSPAAAAS